MFTLVKFMPKEIDRYASANWSTPFMFGVKKMSAEDIAFAVRITDTVNWNFTEKDFEFMLSLEPEGCFVLMHNSEKVGITTTVRFGKVGWVGNVIVSQNYRRRGAGTTLVKHAVNYLKLNGAETVGLYSYKETVDFYGKLGFKCDSEFTVLSGNAFSLLADETNMKKAKREEMQKIIDFDNFYFGASREKLLEKIASAEKNLCYYYVEDGETVGYVMAKVYKHYAEIGPLVCQKRRIDAAEALLKTVLSKLGRFEVSMCIDAGAEALVSMLLNAGFTERFSVLRMFSGPPAFRECIYAAESLERG